MPVRLQILPAVRFWRGRWYISLPQNMKRPECQKNAFQDMPPFSLPHLGRFGEVLGDLGGGEAQHPAPRKPQRCPDHPVKRNEGGEAEQIGPGNLEAVPDGAGEAVRPSAGHRSGSAPLPDRGGCAAGLASSPYRMKARVPARFLPDSAVLRHRSGGETDQYMRGRRSRTPSLPPRGTPPV